MIVRWGCMLTLIIAIASCTGRYAGGSNLASYSPVPAYDPPPREHRCYDPQNSSTYTAAHCKTGDLEMALYLAPGQRQCYDTKRFYVAFHCFKGDIDVDEQAAQNGARGLPAISENVPQPHKIASPVVHSGRALTISLRRQGGVFVVPVLINDAITLNFVVDSGAADVIIPADVVLTLIRTGTITNGDFLGRERYALADGSIVPAQTFRIRTLKIGDRVITSVVGSVAPVRGALLLGQSFLSRFNSWRIDNVRHALVLE